MHWIPTKTEQTAEVSCKTSVSLVRSLILGQHRANFEVEDGENAAYFTRRVSTNPRLSFTTTFATCHILMHFSDTRKELIIYIFHVQGSNDAMKPMGDGKICMQIKKNIINWGEEIVFAHVALRGRICKCSVV